MFWLALLLLLAPVESVKDFGVVGDGVVDDTVAFQKLPTGRTLQVPKGTYKLSGSVTLPQDLALDLHEGAVFTVQRSLTIAGTLNATPSKHFQGRGAVRLNGRKTLAVYPDWWEATSAGMQSAVNAIKDTGGTIRFRNDLYRHTTTVTIASLFPINLIGEMQGMMDGPSQATYGIALSANIDGPMFRYIAPDANHRNLHGGGRISGLAFIDPQNRKFSASAVLELQDFALSKITDNLFQWIHAPAIVGEMLVMSEIASNVIRYCGNGKDAVLALPSTDPLRPAQSLKIDGNRMEVNYGPYVELGANSSVVSLIDNRFEAETEDPPSNQPFIIQRGNAARFIGNSFNRSTGVQFEITQGATANVISGNTFRGGAFPATALLVNGYVNAITGNSFASTRTGFEIDLTGPRNTFTGNTLYWSGSIHASGESNVITGNVLYKLSSLTEYWIDVERSSATIVSNNALDNTNATVKPAGGIRGGEPSSVYGNSRLNIP